MLDFLFSTEQNSLPLALNDLSEEQIESLCYDSIYQRGTNYYDIGAVKDIYFTGKHELVASVQGNWRYDVVIQLSGKNVCASCSCPYEDVCKHLVAVLLHSMLESIEGSNTIKINESNFSSYLNQLSKKKLIDLVERFAPKEFRTIIHNQFVPEDKSVALVAKVVKKVDQILHDESLYYEPADMESALEKQLKKLTGLGQKEAETVFSLIVAIIHKITDLTDEGLLYNHYYDQHFDDTDITEFTRKFLRSLSTNEKTTYIKRIETIIKESEYGFFEGILIDMHEVFEEKDLSELKEILLNNIERKEFSNVQAYYIAVETKLSSEEKHFVLSRVHHLSTTLSIKLAKAFEEDQKIELAIQALEACHTKQDFWSLQETVFNELFRLKLLNKSLDLDFASNMLTQLSDKETLRTVVNQFPDRKQHFENILRQKSILQLLTYFEEEERFDEALAIVSNYSIMEHTKYLFFKKYKNKFTEEAKVYFLKRIEENLIHTGNQYYERIADTLHTLQTIDFKKAVEIKSMIKQTYKRRTNLMALLN